MVGGAADLHVGAVGIEIPVRPASAATTAAATHIAVAVRTAALGTAATLTILVHSVISQVSNIAQSGEVRTRLPQHDIAREESGRGLGGERGWQAGLYQGVVSSYK